MIQINTYFKNVECDNGTDTFRGDKDIQRFHTCVDVQTLTCNILYGVKFKDIEKNIRWTEQVVYDNLDSAYLSCSLPTYSLSLV